MTKRIAAILITAAALLGAGGAIAAAGGVTGTVASAPSSFYHG